MNIMREVREEEKVNYEFISNCTGTEGWVNLYFFNNFLWPHVFMTVNVSRNFK